MTATTEGALTGMTATETIREAARRMRERADTACPGPYFTTGSSARYGAMIAAPCAGHPEDHGYDGHLIGESMSEVNRAHLAGWPPAVALAVAGWLDTVADIWVHGDEVHNYTARAAVQDAALNVAHTYLTREKQSA